MVLKTQGIMVDTVCIALFPHRWYDCDGDPTNGCETPVASLPPTGGCLSKFTYVRELDHSAVCFPVSCNTYMR
jgi:hypothetical protein